MPNSKERMKLSGEVRESGPVDSSWNILLRVPMERIPDMLEIPAVLPLLGALARTVMFDPIDKYVMSHTDRISEKILCSG